MTDRRTTRGALVDAVVAAVRGGVDRVQVREKDLEGGALLACTRELLAALREVHAAARVLVNRRLDVALAAGADGVHLGFDAVPAAVARRLLGPAALVGVAAHAPGELRGLATADLSYAHLAPIFAPLSKPSARPPLGLTALADAARGALPVIAQGGVDATNAGDCVRAGAAGVAVTGAILAAADPGAAASALRRALDAAAPAARADGR